VDGVRGVLLFLLATMLIQSPAPVVVSNPRSRIRTWEVGAGRQLLVLLHGFGSAPVEWLPFTATMRPVAGRRFVFPEAPQPGPSGMGLGWWPLDLASHLDGTGLPDLSRVRPAGLADASARIRTLLPEVEARVASLRATTILGGFSQGGMVSAEIAFRSDTPLKALVLLSPTTVDEASWRAGMSARRGLPVFLAHGRHDTVLPFIASQRLAGLLRDAGLAVTWVPFEGGHDMPSEVVAALNTFLASVDRRR
jgi:phospholipase/carboxylesterase